MLLRPYPPAYQAISATNIRPTHSQSHPTTPPGATSIANGCDQGCPDRSEIFAVRPFNLHAILDTQLAFLNLDEFVAAGVLKNHSVAHAYRFAIDLERLVAMLVLDPEIIADCGHFLAHLIAIALTAWSPELAIITSFPSSSWHTVLLPYKFSEKRTK